MLFSILKHYLELCITDTALKVSRSLYCFTTSISHGVENYFLRLWGMGTSDAIFFYFVQVTHPKIIIKKILQDIYICPESVENTLHEHLFKFLCCVTNFFSVKNLLLYPMVL